MPVVTCSFSAALCWQVDAPELTLNINLSHGGLRLRGKLCPYETALYNKVLAAGKPPPNAGWRQDTSSTAQRGGARL
eukprot:SAG22_NODE_12861_length_427_cov_0.628049_1_plen_77_part_00